MGNTDLNRARQPKLRHASKVLEDMLRRSETLSLSRSAEAPLVSNERSARMSPQAKAFLRAQPLATITESAPVLQCGERDLNPRRRPYQSRALPAELPPQDGS